MIRRRWVFNALCIGMLGCINDVAASDRVIDRQRLMPTLDGAKERNPFVVDPEESQPKPPVLMKQQVQLPPELRKVKFAPNDTALSSEAVHILDQQARFLLQYPKAMIWLFGSSHDGEDLQELHQSRLARQRAEVTRDYLVAKGVPEKQLNIRVITRAAPMVVPGHATIAEKPEAYAITYLSPWYW